MTRSLTPSLRTIASLSLSLWVCVCVTMASSEPVSTMVTLINHVAAHLKTLTPMELRNTLMILFLLTEVWDT
jgi:hypothetical protein